MALTERRHRHIIETAKTLLHDAELPFRFWSFACLHAVYLINRMPSKALSQRSSYQVLFNENPNYDSMRVFGCLCFPWLKPYTHNKLEPRSRPCIYLGYSVQHHCHRCFDPSTSKVFLSRDVVFYENIFPSKSVFSLSEMTQSSVSWDTVHDTPGPTSMPSHISSTDIPPPILLPTFSVVGT